MRHPVVLINGALGLEDCTKTTISVMFKNIPAYESTSILYHIFLIVLIWNAVIKGEPSCNPRIFFTFLSVQNYVQNLLS